MPWHLVTIFKSLLQPLIIIHAPLTKSQTLFLDRDGVLNQVVMRGSEISSPRSRDEFKLAEDITGLTDPSIVNNWNLVIVSNQPDLSRGRIDIELVKFINQSILDHIPLKASFICPHSAFDKCRCRKPEPGLINRFKKDYPQALEKMVFVGDRDTDRECAQQAGVKFILRKRGYNLQIGGYISLAVESLLDLPSLLSGL